MSGTANSYQDFSQSRLRRNALPLVAVGKEAEGRLGVRDRVQLGQHVDGVVLQLALRLGGRVGEPVAAERVRHDVGRHHAGRRSPSGRTACRAPIPVGSSHRTRGTGTSVISPTSRITSNWWSIRYDENTGTSCFGGRDARHPLLFVLLAVGFPASGQDDGLRRHPVGVDAALHGHLRRGAAGHDGRQPLRHHVGQRADVSARSAGVGRRLRQPVL